MTGKDIRPVPPIDASSIPLDAARTNADFARCLNQLRILAGPLSHRQIEARSGGRLGRTKIGQVLNGELPRREFLHVYLRVCGVQERADAAWYEAWARLVPSARIDPAGDASEQEAGAGERAAVDRAVEQADDIVRQAREHAAAITAQALAEAERDKTQELERIHRAEEERDIAFNRARHLVNELDALHESSVERIRAADNERDAALARAQSLSRELHELHESTLERVRQTEDERDTALARARHLHAELTTVYEQITDLRDQLHGVTANLTREQASVTTAKNEIAQLRDQLARIGPGNRVATGRAGEPLELYNDDLRAVPPTIGL